MEFHELISALPFSGCISDTKYPSKAIKYAGSIANHWLVDFKK